MKIPLSLIKSFIHIDLQPAQIAETLTLLGLEVDRIINEHPSFAGVVVGEVLSVSPHPGADRLKVAQVTDGSETFQVVCGAPNCSAGMKTAFAKLGAVLIEENGKTLKIEKAKIRGIESFGMLCSEKELGLSTDLDGIMNLPLDLPKGKDLVPILWDPVFEISLTPNLGHCMSALGIARELSAALQKPIHRPTPTLKENAAAKKIDVRVADFELSPRYMCRLIENVKIAPSPFWLQKALLNMGLTPICNAIDLANYMMIKTGQPFHVFDFDQIATGKIEVSPSQRDQAFLGLDGVERIVPAGTLLICDGNIPLAIAGILGGKKSAVSNNTKNLLIEAGVFDPKMIRLASKKLNFRSESSQRFEKGVDPNGVGTSLDELCHLILEISQGTLAKSVIDLKKEEFLPRTIRCRSEKVNRLLGINLSLTEIAQIFLRLGFSSKEMDGTFTVTVPRFRQDLSEEVDLIEEVARIYGYNHIPQTQTHYTSSNLLHHPAYLFEKKIRDCLVGFGLQEFLTSDLIGQKLASTALEWVAKDTSLLKTLHAKTEEYSILRPSLMPGLLQVAKNNLNYKNEDLFAFEIGKIHFLQNEQLVELPILSLLLSGKKNSTHWSEKTSSFDFFDLKGLLENLFEKLSLPPPSFDIAKHLSFHPTRQANLMHEETCLGSFGEIHPTLLEAFDIKQKFLYAEINLDLLMQLEKKHIRMRPIPTLPSTERDWTLNLPLQIPIEVLFQAIHFAKQPLLEKVELIDMYIPENTESKNATVRFTYRDTFKTISFEEVEKVHTELMDEVLKLLAK